MKIKTFLIIFFLLYFNRLISQDIKSEWTNPLDIPIILSGTFGEIRPNHFHSGIDIKTNGKQGHNVRSVYEGYISRVKVSARGLGKTIYINHSNGLVSVYAHLKKFSSKIEKIVKEKQYKKEIFEIEIFPKKNEINIHSGEIIGYSGNTGGSFGPHLHFEMREFQSQKTINPLEFPIIIKDDRRPVIKSLYVYVENEKNDFEKRMEYPILKINDSVYVTKNIDLKGTISIGLNMFDRQSLAYNKNGVYKALFVVNNNEFEYTYDKLKFSDSKYINLFIDYKAQKKERILIQKLISHPKSKKSFLKNIKNDGYINILASELYKINVEISDYNNNKTYLNINITGKEIEDFKIPNTDKLLKMDTEYTFEFMNKSVFFSKNTFYKNINLNIQEKKDTLVIGEDFYAVEKPFKISFNNNNNDTLSLRQSFIARKNSKNNYVFLNTKKKNRTFSVKSNVLGTFFIGRDSIAPKINLNNFHKGQWISKLEFLKLNLEDDSSGIKSYKGFLNDKWILLEYEPKNKTLTYDFSDIKFKRTNHKLEIYSEDNVGNKTKFNTTFNRKY